jgi:hypothetical protein
MARVAWSAMRWRGLPGFLPSRAPGALYGVPTASTPVPVVPRAVRASGCGGAYERPADVFLSGSISS